MSTQIAKSDSDVIGVLLATISVIFRSGSGKRRAIAAHQAPFATWNPWRFNEVETHEDRGTSLAWTACRTAKLGRSLYINETTGENSVV